MMGEERRFCVDVNVVSSFSKNGSENCLWKTLDQEDFYPAKCGTKQFQCEVFIGRVAGPLGPASASSSCPPFPLKNTKEKLSSSLSEDKRGVSK